MGLFWRLMKALKLCIYSHNLYNLHAIGEVSQVTNDINESTIKHTDWDEPLDLAIEENLFD